LLPARFFDPRLALISLEQSNGSDIHSAQPDEGDLSDGGQDNNGHATDEDWDQSNEDGPRGPPLPKGTVVKALYDYEPDEMSPNEEKVRCYECGQPLLNVVLVLSGSDTRWPRRWHCSPLQNEELSFREGDLMTIISGYDEDGFYQVRCPHAR
jgi:hypothetical protein